MRPLLVLLALLCSSCTGALTFLKCGGMGGEQNFSRCTWRKTSVFAVAFRDDVPAPQCDPTFWQHVYKPQRFTILAPCVTVTGTVKLRRHEPDADWHEQLAVEEDLHALVKPEDLPAFAAAWKYNVGRQRGFLVIEPICIGKVRQADAVEACKGAPQLRVPVVGERVRVTGPLVIDREHGWIEIHAPSALEVLR